MIWVYFWLSHFICFELIFEFVLWCLDCFWDVWMFFIFGYSLIYFILWFLYFVLFLSIDILLVFCSFSYLFSYFSSLIFICNSWYYFLWFIAYSFVIFILSSIAILIAYWFSSFDWVFGFSESKSLRVSKFWIFFLFLLILWLCDFFSLWDEKAKMVIEWKQKRDWQWLWAS